MTGLEMKNEFNLFFNNLSSTSAPGIDDYELSVLLTTSEEQLVKELYSSDLSVQNFEGTEEIRRYLDSIVKTKKFTTAVETEDIVEDDLIHSVYTLPSNLWYIVFEKVRYDDTDDCNSGKTADVHPVTHDEYMKISRNPFRGATVRRALRIDKGNRQVEIVSEYPLDTYMIRYVEKPKPIIITELEGTDSIDGYTAKTDCELPQALHRTIVMRAVQLAASTIEGLIKRQQQ